MRRQVFPADGIAIDWSLAFGLPGAPKASQGTKAPGRPKRGRPVDLTIGDAALFAETARRIDW